MPELPEVETVRLGLAPVLEGHVILAARLRRGDTRRQKLADILGAARGIHEVAALQRRVFSESRRRGLLFYRLLEQAVITDPITYRSLIVNPRPGRPRPTLPIRSPPPPAIERPWRTPT